MPCAFHALEARVSVEGERVFDLPLSNGDHQRILYAAPSRPWVTIVMLPGGAGDVGVERDGDVLNKHGIKVTIGFGQTEASPYITHRLPDDPNPNWVETVGRPLPRIEVKVTHPLTGEIVPFGEVGAICARSYGVMAGYFDNPDASAAAVDADGWLHTGDLGSMDANGYCRIQGRLKDMIIRGGENIYPREIEDVLFKHPSVGNVAVVGVPDQEWGEQVAAFVQARPGANLSEAELSNFCRAHLAGFKVPPIWRFVETLPQTASGKIQKFVLREQLLAEKDEG